MKTNVLKNKKGSALITALAVMVVLMMLCLSLLLISYSLLHTVATESDQQQCKEMARSLSVAIQKELTETHFDTPQDIVNCLNKEKAEHQLWLYLRFNVWNGWNYYNEDNRGHDKNAAYRYFSLKTNGGRAAGVTGLDTALADTLDSITVLIYYEGDEDSGHDDTALFISVQCEKNGQKSAVTGQYQLMTDSQSAVTSETGEGAVVEPEAPETPETAETPFGKISQALIDSMNSSRHLLEVNPLNNKIYYKNVDNVTYNMEKWSWKFVEWL